MADWRRVSRVGLTVVAAGTVALATVLLLARGTPFSLGAPREDSPPEVERSPRADPVSLLTQETPFSVGAPRGGAPPEVERSPGADPASNRSPVLSQTCGAAGFLARASAGPSSTKPSVSSR